MLNLWPKLDNCAPLGRERLRYESDFVPFDIYIIGALGGTLCDCPHLDLAL